MSAIWLVVGGVVAILNGLSIRWSVLLAGMDVHLRAVAWILLGAILRWILVAILLAVALRQGIGQGLMAFLGLWLGRWGIVWWLSRSGGAPDAARGLSTEGAL